MAHGHILIAVAVNQRWDPRNQVLQIVMPVNTSQRRLHDCL